MARESISSTESEILRREWRLRANSSADSDLPATNDEDSPIEGLSPTSSVKTVRTGISENPITLTWRNVNIWSDKPSRKVRSGKVAPESLRDIEAALDEEKRCKYFRGNTPKLLVKSNDGIVKPGEFVALMGASGAGKTTLLNYLAFRSQGSFYCTGTRYLNGMQAVPEDITGISAYIEQDDLFFGALTVREHLNFHATLRLGHRFTKAEIHKKIQRTIFEFGLTNCAETQIGVPNRIQGISGGEMKRLSLASELLWDPQLLICDEPTTGLDIYMATTIIKLMKELTTKNKSIICTIHQPSACIFDMFDRVILLAEGRSAFIGSIKECDAFFITQGCIRPENTNLADHFVHSLAVSSRRTIESLERVEKICDEFTLSEVYLELHELLEQIDKNKKGVVLKKMPTAEYQMPWMGQFRVVLWRSFRCIISDPMILPVRLIQTILISIIVGGVFWSKGSGTGSLTYGDFSSLTGLMFILVTNLSIQYIYCALDGFQTEIPLFSREYYNGMYRLDVYFFAKQLADLPLFIIFPFAFTLVICLMAGLFSSAAYVTIITLIVSILVALCAGSYGYFISAVTPNLNTALIYGAAFLLPMMLYSGYTIRPSGLKDWNRWIGNISWFQYANEAITSYQLGHREVLDRCALIYSVSTAPEVCPISSTVILIEEYGFSKNNIVQDIIGLIMIVIVFRILAFIALWRKIKRE